ncbi:hypothetical protein FVR03_06085 [Pontibacter qinzhouensis]|uniref:Uncharacterized protein n=1 Tax=Pontibacter qinzhouensis TaxID=2603253 RepID=A0A5C8KDP2_9BACT|nr:hypothetical protein [Pontibacter qinzhouensis]TXK49659.1 hypothetical protein FVR03_06085 [Pontibacter qinzhouensis]
MNLNDLPKKNIYKVPDGYFDQLPMQIMARTAGKEARTADTAYPLLRLLRLAMAPLVLLLLFAGVFYMNVQPPEQKANFALHASDLGNTDILAYLNASYVNLEPTDFEDLHLVQQDITSDFINISPEMAEQELEYYQLSNLNY